MNRCSVCGEFIHDWSKHCVVCGDPICGECQGELCWNCAQEEQGLEKADWLEEEYKIARSERGGQRAVT